MTTVTVMALVAISAAFGGVHEGVDLASLEGWDIVIAPDAIASEAFAAEQFQHLYLKASGHKLPIVTSVDRPDRHVFIGPGKLLLASNVAFRSQGMGEEDLRIVIGKGNIAIAGGRTRGSLYGVYTFLEDYLNVRFLTVDHTHVPPVGDWRVIGPLDVTYHPPLDFRWIDYGEVRDVFTDAARTFDSRRRCNIDIADARFGGNTKRVLINHAFKSLIPLEKYAEEHPEYIAMIDGKRQLVKGADGGGQPCLTNPDVLRIVIRAVLEMLEKNPEQVNVEVAQNDNSLYCRCPQCAAIDRREGTPMGSLLTFVNAVADEVAAKHPNVEVGTLAYRYSRKSPKTIKPRPNVQVQLCSYECSITKAINDPSSNRNGPFCRDFSQWGQICNDIRIWTYVSNFENFLLPCPNLRVLETNFRFFVAGGARGIYCEGPHRGPMGAQFSELGNYVMSRLAWNPNLNGNDLIDEFVDLHYGKAAPPIRRFINLVHDNAETKGIDQDCYGTAKDFGLDNGVLQAGFELFDEAYQLADNDVIRGRVEKVSACIYRLAIEEAWVWAMSHRTEYKTRHKLKMDPALKQRTVPYAKRLFDICHKHGIKNTTRRGQDKEQWFKQAIGLK